MNLAELPWPTIASLSKDTPVVFPVAALEQHGHHLPVFTDSLLLGEIILRASEPLNHRVLFAPLMWLGHSDHHLDFAGTLSASPRLYLDLLGGLADNFIQHGFKRLIFVNGHGGNDVPGKQAVYELRQRYRQRTDLLLLFATYWTLGAAKPKDVVPSLFQTEMGHACEWETSMMLQIAPQWVGDFKAVDPVDAATPFAPASRAWITRERSGPGHIGAPHLASTEKGERLLRLFSSDLVAWMERVIRWDGRSWNE